MKYQLIISALLLTLGMTEIQAQNPGNPIANRGYYRTQNAGGIFVHTRGMGAYFRRGWRLTGFSNHIASGELLTLRHPKEYKITNPSAQNSRGYYYGKINSVALLRGSYGIQRTMFDKEVKRGVRVSYFVLFGPTLGFAKPVYVDIRPNTEGRTIEIERYSIEVHNQGEVLGRAPMLYKMGSTRIHPGGHVKYALNFEYSQDDAFIRAIETGANFDVFAKRIPIMDETYNDQFYLTLYLSFHFGKRYL